VAYYRNVTVEAVVKEKEIAKLQYKQALEKGTTAMMAETSDQ